MNILFIGIYDHAEPNLDFRNAIRKVSNEYKEIAINSNATLNEDIISMLQRWPVDLIFMQLQGPGVINTECLRAMKQTGAILVQWTGDARQPLPKHYIEFGRHLDLSLFNNQNDVDIMMSLGVNSDFLQIGFNNNIYKPEGTKRTDEAEILFMGNNYDNTFTLSKYRFDIIKFLRQYYRNRFKLYGSNWPKEWKIESLMYKQEAEAEAYRSCKIGISVSHYDLKKYASDRPFRIMGCGALCVAKEWPEMQEYHNGRNFVTFNGDFADMKRKINYYLDSVTERSAIADNGCEYVHNNCTWDHRVEELLNIINKWKQIGSTALAV